MPRYRTSSWRSLRPQDLASRPAVAHVVGQAADCRVLGLDPGSQRTGFGVIECRGGRCVHVAHGCIDVAHDDFVPRLRRIFEAVTALVSEHRPAEIAVERVFMNRNADSALKLGQARGAALSALPVESAVFEYAPRAVKLALVGAGGADKHQVSHMVRHVLGITQVVQIDASDALAVAICHAHTRRLRALAAPECA